VVRVIIGFATCEKRKRRGEATDGVFREKAPTTTTTTMKEKNL